MENDRFSKWQKLSRLLWVLFVAFVIDNAFGLSSIVYNSFKLDYLVKVEDARRRFGSDKELGYVINCMHEDVVYHKSARGFSKKCGNIMEIVIKDKITTKAKIIIKLDKMKIMSISNKKIQIIKE